MQSIPNIDPGDGFKIVLDIPARETNPFSSQAAHDVLAFVSRYHSDTFSITELTDAVEYSQPSVSKAVDLLAANDLVVERREGNKRTVQVNRDRLVHSDDPFLQIPQASFQRPVRAAVSELRERLDGVLGVVLYGSVARGEADRRSDVDLWVLVDGERMANQRTANRVRQDLEAREFEGERYAYDIDVEGLQAVPNYADELRDVLSDGLVVHDSEKFETVRDMVFHGDLDA